MAVHRCIRSVLCAGKTVQADDADAVDPFRCAAVGAEEQLFLSLRQEILPAAFADDPVGAILQHGDARGAAGELPEHARQLLLRIMIRADIQDHGSVGRIVQKALVALVRLDHEIFSRSFPVIAGQRSGTEGVDKAARDDAGILPQIRERFGQPCADAGFSAGARDCEGSPRAQFHNGAFQRDGAVDPFRVFRSQAEIGIVLFDCCGVDDRVRREVLVDGSVLLAEKDALCAQSLKDRRVFRRVKGAVAARHIMSQGTRHLRQSAHPDAADADEVKFPRQLFHFVSPCSRQMFFPEFTVITRESQTMFS